MTENERKQAVAAGLIYEEEEHTARPGAEHFPQFTQKAV